MTTAINRSAAERTRQRKFSSHALPHRRRRWRQRLLPRGREIMLDLLYDIPNNAPTFKAMQEFLRERRPPTLVATAADDEIFPEEVVRQILTVPDAEYHALQTGHFALEDKAAEIAVLMRDLLDETCHRITASAARPVPVSHHATRPLLQRAEKEPKMNELLDFVLDAHGGLKRWSGVSTLTAKGVLPLPLAQLRAALPALGNPANLRKALSLTAKQFRFGFANQLSREESDALYDK